MPELEVVGGEQLRRHMTDPRLVTLPVTEMLHTAAKEGEKFAISRVQGMSSVVRSIHSDSRALNARVYSTHKAAQHIEVGRRPGSTFPPVAEIARWAARHGIYARGANASGNTLTDLSFVLARSIARRGIKGRYFMRGARSRMKLRWRQYLKGAAADIQRRWKV